MFGFAPVVYEHAARFTGKSPWEVSRSQELLVEAHTEAWKEYHHQPVSPGIDIYNLEAEAYGAVVDKPEGTEVPSITGHICSGPEEILELPHFNPSKDGRIPMVMEAARQIALKLKGVDVRVPVGGPFSIASNLCGFTNLLLSLYDKPDLTGKALAHIAHGQLLLARHIVNHGIGITLFESAATPPMVSPENFEMIEMPALKFLMTGIADASGKASACVMGGDTAPVAHLLLKANPGFLICPGPGETDQEAFIRVMEQKQEVIVRVNMDIGTVVSGSTEALESECRRVLNIVSRRRNTLVGTGVLPYDIDPQRVHLISKILDTISGEKER
jgi:hypothetical protein